jgi:hypothetical protein
MKKFLLLIVLTLIGKVANAQIIPPPYINYQATLYDVNGPNPNAPYANQSFPAFVNIVNELGTLIYKEEHFASTDANGLVTLKMGDGLYVAGTVTVFNNIPWTVNKYYLTIDFVINGVTSSTALEQLVTVPYAFHSGTAGNGISSVADNGNGTLTFTYVNGGTYTTPTLSGLTGPAGPTGSSGPAGPQGANGLSAYELWVAQGNTGTVTDFLNQSSYNIWLAQGNTGTQQQFLNSLVGPQGPQGTQGIPGPQGPIGLTGATGPQGIQGPAGTNGTNGLDGNGIASTTDNGDGTFTFTYDDGSTFTTSDLTGPQGPAGANGQDGLSAYEIWLAEGNTGTESDFLGSLNNSNSKSSIYDFKMISNQSANFYFYNDACSYCDSLTEGGYTDWILPSPDEFAYLAAGGAQNTFVRNGTWLMMRGSYLDQGSNFRRIWGNTFGDIFWSGTTSSCTSPGPHNNCPQYVRCIR